LKHGAAEGWRKSVGQIRQKMKNYCIELKKQALCMQEKKEDYSDWSHFAQELPSKTLLKKGWKGRDDENT
jgi:hypothetical protein